MTLTLKQTATAALAGLMAATAVPLSIKSAVAADGNQFSDVELSYWARPFIEKLSQRKVIAGFPDGTFKPNQPVTRAQFAAILRQAFDQERIREYRGFNDVQSSFWGVPAIREAYETGFMSGYTNGRFNPDQKIPKVQAIVSLASGLKLRTENQSVNASLNRFKDASTIPNYARPGVAAATQNNIVVNYPNLNYLNPDQVTTRAEVAALVYQALVDQGELEPLVGSLKANQYIVKGKTNDANTVASTGSEQPTKPGMIVAQGTRIPVKAPGTGSLRYAIVPSDIYAAQLVVAQDVMDSKNQVLIPQGSVIQGAFRPITIQAGSTTRMATRYVAESVRIGDRTYPIQASTSPRLATAKTELETQDLTEVKTSDAARSILKVAFPNLGRTIFGADPVSTPTTSGDTSVILIDPEQDLDLKVRSMFKVGT